MSAAFAGCRYAVMAAYTVGAGTTVVEVGVRPTAGTMAVLAGIAAGYMV